jgi:hypothetical protein
LTRVARVYSAPAWNASVFRFFGIDGRPGILLSAPVVHAVLLGQWSPWLTAAIGLPWLASCGRPNRTSVWPCSRGGPRGRRCAGLVTLSFILFPGGPAEWFQAIHGTPHSRVPRRVSGIHLGGLRTRRRAPDACGAVAVFPGPVMRRRSSFCSPNLYRPGPFLPTNKPGEKRRVAIRFRLMFGNHSAHLKIQVPPRTMLCFSEHNPGTHTGPGVMLLPMDAEGLR